METAPPQTMTVRTLERRIRRFNGFCVLHGCVLSGFAVVFWILTFYFVTISVAVTRFGEFDRVVPWLGFDWISWGIVALVFIGMIGFGFFQSKYFFSFQVDPDLRAVRDVTDLHLLSPSWWSFFLGALCFAPILTRLAAEAFRRRLSTDPRKVSLAVTVYHYLDDWGDWVPYPSFETQRQAIILLSRLGLVRVSRRFGKHQVKLLGGQPRWKKKLAF